MRRVHCATTGNAWHTNSSDRGGLVFLTTVVRISMDVCDRAGEQKEKPMFSERIMIYPQQSSQLDAENVKYYIFKTQKPPQRAFLASTDPHFLGQFLFLLVCTLTEAILMPTVT